MTFNGTAITIVRGDSDSLTVSIKDRELVEGDIIELTVRKKAYSPFKVLYEKITEFSDGKAVLPLYPADTHHIPFGEYVYDIQWTDTDGTVRTIVKPSAFIVSEEVTY